MNSPSETLKGEIKAVLTDFAHRYHNAINNNVKMGTTDNQATDAILSALLNKLPEKKPITTSPSDDSEGDAYLDGFHEGYNAYEAELRQILEGNK